MGSLACPRPAVLLPLAWAAEAAAARRAAFVQVLRALQLTLPAAARLRGSRQRRWGGALGRGAGAGARSASLRVRIVDCRQ